MSELTKKRVAELFGTGGLYCAETVLTVIAEAGGKQSDDLIRMATGFCSGAGRTCGQCGAMSGAIMGIGLYAGREKVGGDYEPTYALVQEFVGRFKDRFHSINCLELTGCDFSKEADRIRFKEEKILATCLELAEFAADTAIDLLREHGYLPEHGEFLKSRLAPCGLSCGKCLAFAGSPIQTLSVALATELGDNFAAYAKRFVFMNPVFEKYPTFREMLDFLASGSCTGCREKGCLFKECKVPACAREHGVDYCFECPAFPCDRHGMPEVIAGRWLAYNEKMRDEGIDVWYVSCKDKPRYP